MTDLSQACDELAAALPRAAALIADPDTDGTPGGGKPGSAPPWNPAAANAYFDAHAVIRDTERLFRLVVTGSSGDPRPWSDKATMAALDAIENLGYAMPQDHPRAAGKRCRCAYCTAVANLTRAATAILQLAAIDEQERPQRVSSCCPYCGFAMLRVFPRSGRVACLRGGVCQDAAGNPPAGTMGRSQLDGTACITWQDGLVT